MNTELYERMKLVLSEELDVPAEQLRPEASLVDDLGADSLDLVNLALQVEEAFGVEICERELLGMRTIRDVLEYLEPRINAA